MGEKGDDGLKGREGGGVPVIGYAPVVEARGWGWRDWWGIGRFLGAGVFLAVTGFAVEKIGGATTFWSMWAWIFLLLAIGWVVREKPYWKSVAFTMGFVAGSELAAATTRVISGLTWFDNENDGLAHYLLLVTFAVVLFPFGSGMIGWLSWGVRFSLEERGWIKRRG